ncbi:MAG: hypothetical protein L3K18_00390 [Thermoplasmata archaeon]|nr:hypothetical protein [Thermoplasmata archaeon]MCI4355589.1 hypothetical protein [Thermoplasmata archaeon]
MSTADRALGAKPMRVALLLFTRNDLPAAWEQIRSLAGSVDEVVVVDSSDPREWEATRGSAPTAVPVHVSRVLPTGYADVFHPYGVAHVSSEWTLRLDTDEDVSDALLARLRSLGAEDAYLVPRWEAQLRTITLQLRLFRTAAYAPAAPAYAHPRIRGTVRVLPRAERIVHRADFRDYSAGGGRARRYVGVESYERPFAEEARSAGSAGPGTASDSVPSADGGVRPRTLRPLSPVAARVRLGAETVRNGLSTLSPRSARFIWSYGMVRLRYEESLPPGDREARLRIAADIRAHESMTRYLGFDDIPYVDRLSQSWDWTADGPTLLERLLRYRYAHGHPLRAFSDLAAGS